MSIYHIKLLRHGESTGNAAGIIQGQSDTLLTEKGLQQARALARYWHNQNVQFDLIVCSPMQRAVQTAQILAETFNSQIELDPDLVERGFGELEGHSFEKILENNPTLDFYHPYQSIGISGESLVDLFMRASRAIQSLLRKPVANYVVVSHGAFLNMALYAILGISPLGNPKSPRFIFGNTGYADLTYDPDRLQWRLFSFNTQQNWGQEDYQ